MASPRVLVVLFGTLALWCAPWMAGEALATATPKQRTASLPEPAEPFSKAAPAARLNAVDEITDRIAHLVAPVDHPVAFERLTITVRACIDRGFDDPPNQMAFLQIDRKPFPWQKQPPHRIFSGWMFTSSPSISALDDPVYDVTLSGCAAPSSKMLSAQGDGKSL